MDELKLYENWLKEDLEDKDLTLELESIKGDDEAIKDRFYTDIEFGTAGLRGVIGAGINRMNIYTVRRATQGFANYINKTVKNPSVAIGYDSRIKSDLFSKEAAKVFAANGIKTYIYKELMPTPALSFAIRHLKTNAGIILTASHNPAKYNGYKAYWDDGCQIGTEVADEVFKEISNLDVFTGAKLIDYDKAIESGMIEVISDDVTKAFLEAVRKASVNPEACKNSGLKVVYTPLNGTGNYCVREMFKMMGVEDVSIVKEQELPDGNFPTCPFPNPEIKEALALGLEMCKEKDADLLVATDPDADRVGIAVKSGVGEYRLFSGNEVGVLLLDYVASSRIKNGTMPKDPVAVKTIVSTDLTVAVANNYGIDLKDVLTGFKFIGEQIGILEAQGQEDRYIFGFEESYGYLAGTHVRDKDAVVGSMLIVEMAAFYKSQGKSLMDKLNELYEKYGIYINALGNFEFEGAAGMAKMKEIMTTVRENYPTQIGGLKVVKFIDYKASVAVDLATGEKSTITLPKSNVLSFSLEQNCKVIVRPSGTEPKIKVYYTANAKTKVEADAIIDKLKVDMEKFFK